MLKFCLVVALTLFSFAASAENPAKRFDFIKRDENFNPNIGHFLNATSGLNKTVIKLANSLHKFIFSPINNSSAFIDELKTDLQEFQDIIADVIAAIEEILQSFVSPNLSQFAKNLEVLLQDVLAKVTKILQQIITTPSITTLTSAIADLTNSLLSLLGDPLASNSVKLVLCILLQCDVSSKDVINLFSTTTPSG